MFIFFLCILQAKKENEPKERNRRLSKETVKCFIKDFAVTSYGQNLLKTQLFLVKVPSGLRPEPPTAHIVSRIINTKLNNIKNFVLNFLIV